MITLLGPSLACGLRCRTDLFCPSAFAAMVASSSLVVASDTESDEKEILLVPVSADADDWPGLISEDEDDIPLGLGSSSSTAVAASPWLGLGSSAFSLVVASDTESDEKEILLVPVSADADDWPGLISDDEDDIRLGLGSSSSTAVAASPWLGLGSSTLDAGVLTVASDPESQAPVRLRAAKRVRTRAGPHVTFASARRSNSTRKWLTTVGREGTTRKRHRAGVELDPGPPMSDIDAQALFAWPRIALETAMAVVGEAGWSASCLFAKPALRVSSHFSGVGSAEISIQMLSSWSRHVGRMMPLALGQGWTCERAKGLQRLLQARVPGHCVFENVLDRLVDLDDAMRASTGALDFERTRSSVMASRVSSHAQCATHGCLCKVERADIDISGSSCRPWSKARAIRNGERRSHTDVILLLAWCRVIREDKPMIVIHENVRGFDVSLLVELLGDLYEIETLAVAPNDVGFSFLRRPRVYSVLTLQKRVERIFSVEHLHMAISAGLTRPLADIPDLFLAMAEEKLAAENVARAKFGMEPICEPSPCWRYLLTSRQASCLASHEAHGSRGGSRAGSLYVDLTQSLSFACPSLHVPTLRRSSDLIWSWRHSRWLLPTELALMMGFPIRSTCASASGVAVDTLTLAQPQALGNAMHVANVGSIVVAALSACRVLPQR